MSVEDYKLETVYKAIPGTNVKVLFEFPNYNNSGKSAIIVMDDIITISYSTQRTKSPVFLMGQHLVDGYGLGTRIVAGSVMRSVFTTDKLTEFQTKMYLEETKNLGKRLTGNDSDLPSGMPIKDKISIATDDLTAFNIHIYCVTENISDKPRFEFIQGAVIINTGQIYSIEDLISEASFSYQAKSIRSSSNVEDYNTSVGNNTAFKNGSEILKEFLK